ncbi:hypothetical protein [Actinomadura decatromicini]|uniref:Uncharacterized protein n=1 Tax=Actinomadura decatromicini TaxID=2604572 RepID=A0A5D3FJA5_9ACTN|nr:hypothetical protein [Actinomadura decatromicini]TYK48134.1 hypothetical protein FXF68_20935 [Actinomadura decatromicini]
MREPRRPASALARLLILALGLVGVVAGPAGAATHGGNASTGLVSAVRAGTAQQAPARTRTSTKHRPSHRASAHAGRLVHGTQPVPAARLVQAAQAGQLVFAAHSVHAALPAVGVDVRPPSGRVSRADAVPSSPDVRPAGAPRGRAPPSLPRI